MGCETRHSGSAIDLRVSVRSRKINFEERILAWHAVAESPADYSSAKKQLSLFSIPANGNGNGTSTFRDPAFADNKSLPVHRWVPWIAGYSASFVNSVISVYLSKRKTALILDPFCGVGTTLLEAVARGYDAVGFEINPYPALATRAKLNALTVDLIEFDSILSKFQEASRSWLTRPLPKDISPPPLKSKLPFFSSKVERQVLHALAFIKGIQSPRIADLFRVAFGAVMVSFSNYTYEPSLGSRPGAGKPLIEEADVGRVLLNKLLQMKADIAWLRETMQAKPVGIARVINADFFSQSEELESGSVNLMVTSPPYMNNYHYVRNTRPQLYWLNFISCPREQSHLEVNNFGQYWQTVRDSHPIALVFEHRKLEKILSQLRQIRVDKGPYGGPGWANYVASYFNDCFRFVKIVKRMLTRNGIGVVVIGNSIIQGINIPTEKILGEISEKHGLILEGVHCIREKRVGASITQSSVRQGERNGSTLSESVVVFRKR